MNNNFTHLHVHSSYSLQDGYSKPKELVVRAKELGMTALAITDHNHLLGIPDFQDACNKAGIKPILGYEAYYTEDMNILALSSDERTEYAIKRARELGKAKGFDFDAAYLDLEQPWDKKHTKRLAKRKVQKKDLNALLEDYKYDTSSFHLILLAKNQTGWKNIVKIQSESAAKCKYNGRYHCDLNLLKKYSEGIICTTACIGSYFADKIISGNYEEAKNKLKEFHSIFKDDFYIEIQPLNIPKQHETNFFLLKYAKELGINIVATNDVHYALKDDNIGHSIIVNLGLGRTVSTANETTMVYSHDYWLRSYDEMVECFKMQYDTMFIEDSKYGIDNLKSSYMDLIYEALNNTNIIADKIESIAIGSSIPLFPNVKIPEGFTQESYLEHLCLNGLFEYKANNPEIDINLYLKRLFKELHIIKKKGYSPYFLTVYNYVNYCKQKNIPVGPGRGSASGSLCLYMLKITSNIDPIKYGLPFERFLTEDRTSPPDCINIYQLNIIHSRT